jgi:hypothetical protein
MMYSFPRSTQWRIFVWLIVVCLQQHQQPQHSALAFFVTTPPRLHRPALLLGVTSSSSTTVTTSTTKAEASPPMFTLATSMTTTEKVAMNVIGVGLTTLVVTSLANSQLNAFLLTPTPALLNLEEVGTTIMKVSIPSSTAEVVSVTLAESAAGVVAAAVSLLVAVGLGAVQPGMLRSSNSATREKTMAVDTIGRAIGNGDFLVAQATAMPILESLGIPPSVATIVAVVFAAIPAEVVKVTSAKQTVKKIQEERLLRQLLEEEAKRRRTSREQPFPLFEMINNNKGNNAKRPATTSLTAELDMSMDMDMLSTTNVNDSLVVEIVSDLIKWLGYAVLCSDLGGRIVLDNGQHLFPGLESAAFGAIASLSAQIYSDVLYYYFGFGGIEKQQQVRSRTVETWLSAYTFEAVSGATLFGVYDIIKIPAKAVISAFLSGGVDGCIGSQELDLCLQSYVSSNPLGASPEAELRSLITTLVSLWNQLVPLDI